MTHSCRFLLAVLLALALAPALARAQAEPSRPISLGIGGGLSVPVSDAKDAFQNGFNGQVYIRVDLRPLPLSVRADVTYQNFDVRTGALSGAGAATGGTGTVLGGLANTQVYLMMSGHLRPYLLAGVGAYNIKTELDGTNAPSQSDTRFGVNGGAGIALALGAFSAYVEGRVDNVFTERGLIDTKTVQLVPVTLGVVF